MYLMFILSPEGETSAGKSSFLNLLFGEDILPVHHNPCTSVITKISYGVNRRARIVHMNGDTEEIENIHQGEMKDKLWDRIFVTDVTRRESVSRISEVQLSLPMEILKVYSKSLPGTLIKRCTVKDRTFDEIIYSKLNC